MSIMINRPAQLTVSVPATVGGPGTSRPAPERTLQVAWSQSDGRYVAMSVTVTHPLQPVTTHDLSRSAVRRTIADGLRPAILEANPHLASSPVVQTWAKGPNHHARKMAAAKQRHPGPEALALAALVLDLERTVGGPPVKTLARCLGLGRDEARRWADKIRRIRNRGR